MDKPFQLKLLSALNVVFGALSFLMMLPGAYFWVGLPCALAALILGAAGRKNPAKSRQACSIIGIILAVAGAASFIIAMYLAGYRYTEIL